MANQVVTLPALGAEGTLTVARWLKQPGARIGAGEKLLEAHSERFDWDIPAPGDGVLLAILAEAGIRVAPGDALAQFDAETIPQARARISPLAQRVAQALGADVNALRGSGAGGRILRADVLTRVAQVQPLALADVLVPFSAEQHARAAQVSAARKAVPHAAVVATLVLDAVDADIQRRGALWRKRERFELDRLPYLVAAALAALRAGPQANAVFAPEAAALRAGCHLAVQIDENADFRARRGFIAHAEQYALIGIARRLQALAPGDGNETFRLRVHGGLLATATLAPGEGVCLTLGAAARRAAATHTGELAAQTVMHACLTYDARLVNEADGARLLAAMQQALDAPERAW